MDVSLKLDGLELVVQRQAGWAGSDAWHVGMFKYWPSRDVREVKINLRNLEMVSLKLIIVVLAHEMRHAFQNAHGMTRSVCAKLHENAPITNFKDKRYTAWFNRAEEIDARAFEGAYAQVIFNDPRFAKFNIDEQVQLPMVVDAAATEAKYHRDGDEIFKFVFERKRGKEEVFFMYASQFGAKRITKAVRQTAFTTHLELLKSQKIEPVMRELTIRDMTC